MWKLKWVSCASHPNKPYGVCGRKSTLNYAHALVTVCSEYFNPASEDIKLHIIIYTICDSVWIQWRQGNSSKSEMHIWSTVLHYTVSQALKTSIKVCSGFKGKTFVSSGFSTERTLIFLSCELLQHFGTVYGVLVQLQHTRSLACFHNQQWKESTHNGVN